MSIQNTAEEMIEVVNTLKILIKHFKFNDTLTKDKFTEYLTNIKSQKPEGYDWKQR